MRLYSQLSQGKQSCVIAKPRWSKCVTARLAVIPPSTEVRKMMYNYDPEKLD